MFTGLHWLDMVPCTGHAILFRSSVSYDVIVQVSFNTVHLCFWNLVLQLFITLTLAPILFVIIAVSICIL